jgi:hypothetical protein
MRYLIVLAILLCGCAGGYVEQPLDTTPDMGEDSYVIVLSEAGPDQSSDYLWSPLADGSCSEYG